MSAIILLYTLLVVIIISLVNDNIKCNEARRYRKYALEAVKWERENTLLEGRYKDCLDSIERNKGGEDK